MISLLETRRQFATAMDSLRQHKRGEFQHTLGRDITGESSAAWHQVENRIALARQQLADDFLEKIAVPAAQRQRPNAVHDITAALREFQTDADKSVHQDALPRAT